MGLEIIIGLIVAFVGGHAKKAQTDSCDAKINETPDSLLLRWVKQRRAPKIDMIVSITFLLGFILFIAYVLVSNLRDWPKIIDFKEIIDFDNMTGEEIMLAIREEIVDFIAVFIGVAMAGALAITALGINSAFNLAGWISENNIDGHYVLNSGLGSDFCNALIGDSFLIIKKPKMKRIYFIKLSVYSVIAVVFPFSVRAFLRNVVTQVYEETDGVAMLVSPSALCLYSTLVITVITVNVVRLILGKGRKNLMKELAAEKIIEEYQCDITD